MQQAGSGHLPGTPPHWERGLPARSIIARQRDSSRQRGGGSDCAVASGPPAAAAQSGLPDWLGGKPDVVVKPDRCMLYDWFFKEADSQTEGKASQDDLARKRVRLIATRIV